MKLSSIKQTLLLRGVVLGLGAALVSMAQAVEQAPGFYLQPTIDFHLFDDDLDLDSTFGVGVDFGYQYNTRWGVEVDYETIDTQHSSGTDVTVDYYHIDALYNFVDEHDNGLIPFIQAGLGEMNYTYDSSPEVEQDDTLLNLGVGFKYQPVPSVQYRMGLRSAFGLDEHTADPAINLGVAYLFDAPAKVVAKPAPAPVVVAPAPVVAVAKPAPVVVAPVVVLPPADGDKDGVLDADDKCPDTKAGALVDKATGCYIELTESREFTLDVKFKSGSSELDASTKGSIADLAKFLVSYPQTSVVIEGHTDNKGSAALNKTLSQKRADSVRNSLINDYATDASRVTAIGYGLEKPIADNATEVGRAQNRRVVAKVQASVKVIKQ